MKKELLAQEIAGIIRQTIPETVEVTQTAVYGEVTATSYLIYYYVKVAKDQKWYQCYKIYRVCGASEKALETAFAQIALLLRENVPGEWSNFTLLEKDAETPELLFDNTDLSEGSYAHMQQWEKIYLV